MYLLYLLPKNWLSRLMGKFVRLRFPRPISQLLIRTFAKTYQINLLETEHPIESYPSVGDFFIRKLKSSARPLGTEGVLHPADSVVNESGPITNGRLIQAKGRDYSLTDFVGSTAVASNYKDGSFATYYLCPTDYHRVHSPVDGYIKRVVHIPGHLWPVNDWSTKNIKDLFSVNERVIIEIESAYGMIAVVFVGATNVGEISLSFWPEFRSNIGGPVRERTFDREVMLSKGDELGIFHMGSTVVLLFSPQILNNQPVLADSIARLKNRRVRVRSNISDSQPLSVPTVPGVSL